MSVNSRRQFITFSLYSLNVMIPHDYAFNFKTVVWQEVSRLCLYSIVSPRLISQMLSVMPVCMIVSNSDIIMRNESVMFNTFITSRVFL